MESIEKNIHSTLSGIAEVIKCVMDSVLAVPIPLDKFILNGDAAILIAKSGQKVVIKLHPDDEYDAQVAFLRCYLVLTSSMSKNKASRLLNILKGLDGRKEPTVMTFNGNGLGVEE